MSIIFSLLILCLVVVVHEYGHLLVAKANGINVTEFWVGFGPKLFSFEKGGGFPSPPPFSRVFIQKIGQKR